MIRPFPQTVIAEYSERGSWGAQSIFDVFAGNRAAHPDRLAIVDAPNRSTIAFGQPARLSYEQLGNLVDRMATVLGAHELGPGSIMLVQMPNLHELVALYLAAASIGVVVSPVPIQYRYRELRQIVDILKPRAFCSVARAGGTDLLGEFAAHVAFDGLIFGIGEDLPSTVIDLSALAKTAAPTPQHRRVRGIDPNHLFSICWTSGTEGAPKAVPKTHNNWLSSARGTIGVLSVEPGDAILAPFPFVNAAAIGGLMMTWLGCGGALVLHHPFDIAVFVQQIRDERVRYTVVAPAILSSLLDAACAGEIDLGGLRSIGTGSAPPDPSVVARFEAVSGVPLINIFGSNEGINLCSHRAVVADPFVRARLFPRDGDETWNDEGRTANGGHFRLVDEMGRLATIPGEIGEMRIRGPSVFPGYWNGGGFDRAGFDEHGYFATGDLFEIVKEGDEAKYIRFVGRSRELIVRGGMKISPAELDAIIATHPDVREAAVAPLKDERLGERVCAFVVPRNGRSIPLQEIVDVCRDAGLARFKWPERIVQLDALPRNALAKVQRRELAKLIE